MFEEISLFLKALDPRTWMKIIGTIVITLLLVTLVYKVEQWGESRRAEQDNKTIVAQQTKITDLTVEINQANELYNKNVAANEAEALGWRTKLQESNDEAAKELNAAKAVSANTTAINSQLRQQLSTASDKVSRLPDTAAARAATAEYVSTLSSAFGDCTRQYQDMADLATIYATDAKRLYNGWPTNSSGAVSTVDDSKSTSAPPENQ